MNNESTTKYQGWTNYATWRVNLEIFDGMTFGADDSDFTPWETVRAFADFLKEEAEEAISINEVPQDSLAYSYAQAFLGQVNYYEIASLLVEENPHLVSAKTNTN